MNLINVRNRFRGLCAIPGEPLSALLAAVPATEQESALTSSTSVCTSTSSSAEISFPIASVARRSLSNISVLASIRLHLRAAKTLSKAWQIDSTSLMLTERAAPLRLWASRYMVSMMSAASPVSPAFSSFTRQFPMTLRCSSDSILKGLEELLQEFIVTGNHYALSS